MTVCSEDDGKWESRNEESKLTVAQRRNSGPRRRNLSILVWRFLRGAFNGRHQIRATQVQVRRVENNTFATSFDSDATERPELRMSNGRPRRPPHKSNFNVEEILPVLSTSSVPDVQVVFLLPRLASLSATSLRAARHHGVRLRSARDLNAVLASPIPG
ncbi:hypothetical protein BDZ89DRAFT_1237544 [Hymenopellis radicata]|nr:hypothetical protein BDZ89DRAFT_1237544 [Hymenopellis radicata]